MVNYKSKALAVLTITATTLGLTTDIAKADPVALPDLPNVFCFRLTDIKSVTGDAEGDKFQFEFESLNWTTGEVDQVQILRNEGTTALPSSARPFFTNASIDQNGRLIGPNSTPLPGNQPTNNNWTVGARTSNDIVWNGGNPIPNIDLLRIQQSTGTTQGIINAVNALNPPGGHFPNRDFNPQNNVETIDNGTNVLDGFVFEADNFNEGEVLSFNWFLSGSRTSSTNGFTSGVVNLKRVEGRTFDSTVVFPTFTNQRGTVTIPGNTGVSRTAAQFAGLGGVPAGIAIGPDNPELQDDAYFALEFGAVRPTFLPTAVPEPITILGTLTVAGFLPIFKKHRSIKKSK